jgi:hypothetical protein
MKQKKGGGFGKTGIKRRARKASEENSRLPHT